MRRYPKRPFAAASALIAYILISGGFAPAHSIQNPSAPPPVPRLPSALQIQSLRPPAEFSAAPAMRGARGFFVPGETISLIPPMDAAQFDQSGLGASGALAYLRAEGGSTWSVPVSVVESVTLSSPGIFPGAPVRPARQLRPVAVVKAVKTLKSLSMEVPQLPRGKYSVWYVVSGKTGPTQEISIAPLLSAAGQTIRAGETFTFAVRMVGPTAIPQAAANPPQSRDLPVLRLKQPTMLNISKIPLAPIGLSIEKLNYIRTPVTLAQITSVGGDVVGPPDRQPPITVATDSSGLAQFTLQARVAGTSRLNFTAPGFDPIDVQIQVTPPPPPPPPPAPLYGFADLHFHWMSHESWGGRMFAGRPEGPLHLAMPWCTDVHLPGGILPVPENFHLVGGFPQFDGWPRFVHGTFFHQQSHVDWVRRAYDRGLRMVSMLAVNNELLAGIYGAVKGHNYPPTDMNTIVRQIQAMKDVASRNTGWMEIAYSAADLRRIVRANKLAIVLGIEVDSLFWRNEAQLRQITGNDPNRARALIQSELKKVHDMGVRQITPVHLSDNAYGGSAIYNQLFDFNSFLLAGSFNEVETAGPLAQPITYRLDLPLPAWLNEVLNNPVTRAVFGAAPSQYAAHAAQLRSVAGGHVNRRGLSQYGAMLIEEMMKLGMVIDVDHMGEKTVHSVLDMAKARNYPVIASHTGFREMAAPHAERGRHAAHEGNKSAYLLQRIKELGGVVALILDQGEVKTYSSQVANDAPGTSKSWAQSYLYALDKMDRKNIAIGTDFGGKDIQLGPRFGTYGAYPRHTETSAAAKAERRSLIRAQTNGVRYATPLNDYRGYRWEGDAGVGEEKFYWEGVALGQSNRDIDSAPMPALVVGIPPRTVGTNAWIKDVAKGIRGAKNGVPFRNMPALSPFHFNALGTYWWAAVQRGAYLAWTTANPAASSDAEVRSSWNDVAVKDAYNKIRPIAVQFRAMIGSNPPIPRSVAGDRDFDFNIDGFAHYGLFPDFFQDLKNVGLTDADLAPLFRSADAYVQMWEKCERNRPR